MKKIRFPFVILLALVIFICGCSNDQYGVERQYWYAQKQAEKIFNNPQGSPPKELEKTVNTLQNFIENHPKSPLVVNAEFNIATLYIVKKEYQKARAQLKRVLDKYPLSKEISSESTFLIGNTFELQDEWPTALAQYKKIMEEFQLTPRGLTTPIYIAQHYKIKFQPDKMLEAFEEAIAYYKGIAQNHPDTPVSLQSYMLIADCYSAMREWSRVINTLNTILEKYQKRVKPEEVLLNIAVIYKEKLSDKANARQALERIIKEYPKSPVVKTANSLLKELK